MAFKILEQLFNHGWAEDYSTHLEYNGHDKLSEAFWLACQNKGKELNEYIDDQTWDEEAEFGYDDGGLTSFIIEIFKIFKQYGLLEVEDKTPKPIKNIRQEKKFIFSCPHCNKRYNYVNFTPEESTVCENCEGIMTYSL